jgi:hypothetical protein
MGTGATPSVVTLAEATFNGGGQADYYDVSIINGANFAVQFSPSLPPTAAYACGIAGSTAAQPGPLPAATWTMNVSPQNLPMSLAPSNDAMSYFLMVASDQSQTCTQQSNCTGVAGPTCGFAISSLTGTFDAATRYCGTMVAWMPAYSTWGYNVANPAGPNPSTPFGFTAIPSGASVRVGDLQQCLPALGIYSSYSLNNGVNQYLACGGVMWGPTESPPPVGAISGQTGLGIIQPAQPVQTVNSNWLTYVEPTIQWLKTACPTCYTYPYDDMSATFTCTDAGQGIVYTVQFSDLH